MYLDLDPTSFVPWKMGHDPVTKQVRLSLHFQVRHPLDPETRTWIQRRGSRRHQTGSVEVDLGRRYKALRGRLVDVPSFHTDRLRETPMQHPGWKRHRCSVCQPRWSAPCKPVAPLIGRFHKGSNAARATAQLQLCPGRRCLLTPGALASAISILPDVSAPRPLVVPRKQTNTTTR